MTDRPFTTELFCLRASEIGLRPEDLDFYDVGQVLGILAERQNDVDGDYKQLATQADFDRF